MMEKDTRSFIHSMQQTTPFDLRDRIIATLTDPTSELWFPHLTYDLMQSGLQNLLDTMSIREIDYGTARVILKDVNAKRFIEKVIFTDGEIKRIKNGTFIEMPTIDLFEHYKEPEVDFYTREELQTNSKITECLKDAFEVIKLCPSLFTTVRHLVKSIHLIKPEDDEYDISFSEPLIPFSIFVSVPQENNPINALRVAEAIVHETIHLQLTLIEAFIPLVIINESMLYSPWKTEYRTVSGVLHALFVFRILKTFSLTLIKLCSLSPETKNYLNERTTLIAQQIAQISNFAECSDLTPEGRILVKRCLI